MIKYSEEEGFIEIKGIRFKENYKGSKNFPVLQLAYFLKY